MTLPVVELSMTTTRPSFTLSEAAKLVAVSRSSIRRYRESGDFPNSYQDDRNGQWMIPIEDLLAKGLKPVGELSKTTTLTGPAREQAEPSSEGAPTLAERLKDAEHALALERAERKGIENLLHEVERRADLAERALLMIEAPKSKVSDEPHSPIPVGPGKVHLDPADFPGLNKDQVDDLEATARRTGQELKAAHAEMGTPKRAWWKW
jgi:hypothetical protein